MLKICSIFYLLNFLFGLAAPVQYFLIKPSNTTVREGESTVLYCAVGNPAHLGQTVWVKDGGLLGTNSDYKLKAYPRLRIIGNHANGEYHLEVLNTTVEDDAEYECQVQPSVGGNDALRGTAYLNVIAPPSKVQLIKDGQVVNQREIIEVKSDTNVDVTCQAIGGKPAPEMHWFKLQQEKFVQLADHFIENSAMTETDRFGRSRTIYSSKLHTFIRPADNGSTFVCEAQQPAIVSGQPLRAYLPINVIYPPGSPRIHGYDGRILKSGERLSLTCSVLNGNPEAYVYWYKNQALIDRTYTVDSQITFNFYEFNVDPSDNEAEYTCESSNDAAVTPLSASFRLRVSYVLPNMRIGGRWTDSELIIVISLFGLILLIFHALLVYCFARHHQRRKLMAKSAVSRIGARKKSINNNNNEKLTCNGGGGCSTATNSGRLALPCGRYEP